MAVLELKYQYAKEDRKLVICQRLSNKAAHILERIEKARAIIQVMFRRDWDEAIEMNKALDQVNKQAAELLAALKENADATVDTNNRGAA